MRDFVHLKILYDTEIRKESCIARGITIFTFNNTAFAYSNPKIWGHTPEKATKFSKILVVINKKKNCKFTARFQNKITQNVELS